MSHGLTPTEAAIVGSILSGYADRIERAAVFGSRATGLARANSDIDLVLYGTLLEADVDRLWTLFDDSALSVSVDVLAYDDTLYPPLRRHIDATAVAIFSQDELCLHSTT